jgi:hypothetical protein
MSGNLSQLLLKFDEWITTYFLEIGNLNYQEHELFFQKKIESLTILLPQIDELAPNFLTQRLATHFINQEYEQLFRSCLS